MAGYWNIAKKHGTSTLFIGLGISEMVDIFSQVPDQSLNLLQWLIYLIDLVVDNLFYHFHGVCLILN